MRKKYYNISYSIVGFLCLASAIVEPTVYQRAILIIAGAINLVFVNVQGRSKG